MKLFVNDPVAGYKSVPDCVVLDAARSIIGRKMKRGAVIANPAAARRILPALLGGLEHEVFCVAFLDIRHRLIEFREMFRGTVDGASVHPREVLKAALAVNAVALILIHNHPSGVDEPSVADDMITQRIKEACAYIDVRLIDHFIVAGTSVYSYAEKGHL